jgi:glycosyltransferase involved in cell wall biosynthesis
MSRLKTLIRDVDPDVVHLNHLFSPAYVLLPLFLKFTGFYHKKVVLSPRGALFDGALSVKPYKNIPFMAVFKMTGLPHRIVFHATNERESLVIKKHFGDVSVMIADNPSSSEKHSLEKIAKAEGCLHLVYIARLHPIKNLKFILDVISRITDVDIHLQVYGPEEDRSYWATCQQVIAAMPANIRVDYGGPLSNKEVLAEISKSQLFVLPTTGENFGHSIFESLKAGRPVLISDRTPWRDLQAKRIGWDLPLEEPAQWENAIRSAGKWGQDEMDRYSVAAWSFARDYEEGSVLKQKYIELFS